MDPDEEDVTNPKLLALEELMAHSVAQRQILSLLWAQEHQREMERRSRRRAKAQKSGTLLSQDAA